MMLCQARFLIAEFKIPNNINELSIGIADSQHGRYEIIVKYIVN